MRDLKFRIWNREEKNWDNPSIVEIWDESGKLCSMYDTNYEKTVIQQFTGLKDINEKDVYEGDVVETIYGDAGRCVVVFDSEVCQFRLVNDNNKTYPLVTVRMTVSNDTLLESVKVVKKVIGNIFESEHLI